MKPRKTRNRKKSDFILFVLFVMVVLSWQLFGAWRDWRDWRDSDTWLSTRSSSFAINHKSSTVRYTYVVHGVEHTSYRVRFFGAFLYEGIGDLQWQHAYRNATEVTVYYDPEHPERSVLVREVAPEPVFRLFFNLLYCCFALLLPFLLIGLSFSIFRRLFRGL